MREKAPSLSKEPSPLDSRTPAIAQTQQLQQLLLEKIIPWVESRGMANVFTAYPSWQKLKDAQPDLPDGATVTPQPLRGPRVRGLDSRSHGNTGLEEYRWPDDQLLSARAPKLCFVLEGPVAFQIADYVLHCGPGHGILLPPGTPFPDGQLPILDRSKDHQNACEMLMILPVQGSIMCWTSRQWYEKPEVMLQKSVSGFVPQNQVTDLLYRLIDEATRQQLHWQRLCRCILEMVLSLMHRGLQEIPAIKAGDILLDGMTGTTQPRQHPIKRVEEYIQNNLQVNAHLPLTIEQMARYASLSRTIFIQQFRARTGKSFNQYVSDCRYERACELLQGSDLAINQISGQVGLSPRRLRVLIQQRAGVSPTTLRSRYRNSK